jgi:hypothetical protein
MVRKGDDMDRDEVLKALINILNEVQGEVCAIGEEPEDIKEATCPIGGISFFDSLAGVVVTVRCIEKFKLKDDGKIISLFQGKKNGFPYALTVGEVVDRIISLSIKE